MHLRLVGSTTDEPTERALSRFAARYGPSEVAQLERAVEFCSAIYEGRRLPGGEPLLGHAIETAAILAELGLDLETLIAAILFHSWAAKPGAVALLRERFDASVVDLAEGVVRMAQIGALSSRQPAMLKPEQHAAQLEALRKMLLAMVQDIRVVLVKLADHVQDLRFLVRQVPGDVRLETAQRTYDLFSPLASRLGVWQLKWEMEDLSLRILEPDTYRTIARQLDEKRVARERYIENVVAQLKGELARAGVAAEVTGRPKHIYSIYKKMERKQMEFDALHDVRAVRLLVNDVKDCYAALGLTHNLWTPIPKEFDDYIAKPKGNQYRSLHTAVIGPEGKAVEVQIRTHEMHRHAELGVAAHWRYKEGARGDRSLDEKLAWLRQILEWKDEVGDAGELAERFRTGLADDTIYVLTPQGKVIDLPRGATPVDFAYHVHSSLGHRCRGAKVDGNMVPLNTPLANGQQVEILPAKEGGPSRDWLNPALGYVKSAGARSKIRQWFNRQNPATAATQGRAILEKELNRQGVTGLNIERLAAKLGYSRTEDLLAEAGRGEIRPRQLQEAVRALRPRPEAPRPSDEMALPVSPQAEAPASRGGILIVGVDRLLTVPARCCKPLPPEPIIGFVTRGRGVSVHRASCSNVARLDQARLVPAQWGRVAGSAFAVDVEIEAATRSSLTREISEALAREKIRLLATRFAASETATRMRITLEVEDLAQLRRVLLQLQEVRGVARVGRR